MSTINFVPSDYIQKRDSSRANVMYLILFVIVMAGIVSTFSIIKMRQKSMEHELEAIDAELLRAHEKFALLEKLELKAAEMMNAASMTSDLYENAQRSVILACLTNNLPKGVSLTKVKLFEKEGVPRAINLTQYQQAAASANAGSNGKKIVATNIEIEGIAPSDIEVASFMSRLASSFMFEEISLVESKEKEINERKYREYKLSSVVQYDLEIKPEHIEQLKERKTVAMSY